MQTTVVIVGAGPYGLSMAAYLQGRGIPFRIFGDPMLSWRNHMPRGMLLKSEGFASNLYDPESALTLGRYCGQHGIPYRNVGEPVPLETFVAYGLSFQRQLLPQLDTSMVVHLARHADGFTLTTSSGETLTARRVIIACGITHFAYVPPILTNLPPELISHSFDHSDLSALRGRRVAVIGAGASAIDIAALLHEAGAQVHLVARRKSIAFHEPTSEPRPLWERLKAPRSGLGLGWRSRLCTDAPLVFRLLPEHLRRRIVERHLGPAPGWFMKERTVGRFPLHLSTQVSGAQSLGSGVNLDLRSEGGSSRLNVDHVIAATGFRVDLRRLPFVQAPLLDSIGCVAGSPALSANFECSVPGLYMIGLASANCFGPLARFAYGAGFTVRRLASHLAALP